MPPLANTRPSSSALAQAVLDGLARRDAGALRDLALSEQEFKAHVWPELPASRPERNLPFHYVWGELEQKSASALAAALARFGGDPLTLVRVEFDGPMTPYDSFVIRRQTRLVVRDAAGHERSLRLFGSMLQKQDRYKLFSYVTD